MKWFGAYVRERTEPPAGSANNGSVGELFGKSPPRHS